MTRLAPRRVKSGWPIAIRTKLFDDLILKSVAEGCESVVNIGAGFDSRPYRLPLPERLRWIEADLPALVDEKERLLSHAEPVCLLQRERLDLVDDVARRDFLDRINVGENTLLLSEGFAVYLEDEQMRTLAKDILARSALRWWLLDFFSPSVLKMMRKSVGRDMNNAPFKFAPSNGVAFFEALGWQTREVHSIFGEAARLGRAPWPVRLAQWLPEPDPRSLGKASWAAVVRFDRGAVNRGVLTR